MVSRAVSCSELSEIFRYDGERLFRFHRKYNRWQEINTSVVNHSRGYIQVKFKTKMLMAHRVIYSLCHRIDIDVDMQIDHINGNRADNRSVNLRLVTPRGNSQNLKAHRIGKLCGCSFNKKLDRWVSHIRLNGSNIYLGAYCTERLAFAAYIKKCIEFNIDTSALCVNLDGMEG